MGAPNSTVAEVDLSTRVPSFPGVFAGIVIPGAQKGEVGVPQLMTSSTQFLKTYTADEKVNVGDDLAYFSALQFLEKSNKLWVIRTANGALQGGLLCSAVGGVTNTTPSGLASGEADAQAHSFAGTDYSILVAGRNAGAYNNDLRITIADNNAKEAGSFIINVFKSADIVNPLESFVCHKTVGHKDGFGRNIYVEDVVKASEYIQVADNIASAANPSPITVATALTGGTDGVAVTDGNMITDLVSFENVDSFPMTLILDGGRATAAYQQAVIATVEKRQSCVAILSTPFAAEDAATYLTDIQTYRNTTLNANSSHAALYSAHVKIYDAFNDRELWVSPDGVVAAQISETAMNQEIWYPVGGFRRGMVNVLDVRRRYTQGEMDLLYDDGINPIRFIPGKGISIWGQKTLSARPSALDRLNVRLMLTVVEPAVQVALEDFIFEINDAATRALIAAMISSYMENIRSRRGVYDYKVTVDETNNTPVIIDQNKLEVWLFVKPTKSAEFIKTTVVITTTGASFKAAAQSLAA